MKDIFTKALNCSKHFITDNSASILTGLGVVGVVATSVSAVKSYKRYEELMIEESCDRESELDTREKIRIMIPTYAPTIFIGFATISCIIGSNVINQKKQASLASAYMFLDGTFKNYRSKVNELYGEDADDRIMSELMKDEYNDESGVVPIGEKRLFFEPISRTYFEASMEEVNQAEYLLNRELALSDYVKVNDFLRYLGADWSDVGEIMGWSSYEMHESNGCCCIDFKHEIVELEDGLECCIIKYPSEPKMDFMDY